MTESIGVSGTWIFTWSDGTRRIEKNIITQSGLESLAALFIGELPQSSAMYLALGTGETAAANGDKKLEAEGFRKILTSKTRELNEVRLRFFLVTSEANGEWSEMGIMLAGTEGKDSGWNLNHILPPGGIRKASNQTLTVEVRIKFQGGELVARI